MNASCRGKLPKQCLVLVSAAVCLATWLGCGASHPPVAEAVGTVTYQSQPVTGGRVLFLPLGGGKQSLGTVQSDGSFRLSTFGENDGALVGRHHAIVVNVRLADGTDETGTFEIDHEHPLVVEAGKMNEFQLDLAGPCWKNM